MELSKRILSDITVFNKYAKFIPMVSRRETFDEICDRYEYMMLCKYPTQLENIKKYMPFIRDRKILPSMRAMQFAGGAITKNESRIYNCAYLPIDDHRAFSEVMFLLLGGTGVGYSVQYHHIDKLPVIRKPLKEQKYLIGDSIEGWADAVRHLMSAYFGIRSTKPRFDYSDIRAKGSRLVTAGGKAPGPEPLKTCLFKLETMLERKKDGDKLSTLEVHDIVCHIADAVLAGGIRRAALISLFSADDESMSSCKAGAWWELNPQRGRANNSAMVLRYRVSKRFFKELWRKIRLSGSGEPGLYLSNNADWGANPCCEIALRPYQFCNLCEVNADTIEGQEDFNERAEAAAFFGTLQAGFTDFHYLRPIWKKTTEKDALIGVGLTGIASGQLDNLDLEETVERIKAMNARIADDIKINTAARLTTVKPSGTTSCVLGTSSGIHAWYSQYYIRRMQMTKDEPLYKYLIANHPELVSDYHLLPNSAVAEIPQTTSIDSITREKETAIDMLERVVKFNKEWVRAGHVRGDNTNNVSATVSIQEEEWDTVGEFMWENKDCYNGLSVLPYDGGTYKQAPFEEISEDEFYERYDKLKNIDLTQITEEDDMTEQSAELACAGGICEIV